MREKVKENEGRLREEKAADLKRIVELYKKLKEEDGKLREENASLKQTIAEVAAVRYAGSELQQKISEISSVEVPTQAVNELV